MIRLNEEKSTHLNFTNKRSKTYSISLNKNEIPLPGTAKWFAMRLLRWKDT